MRVSDQIRQEIFLFLSGLGDGTFFAAAYSLLKCINGIRKKKQKMSSFYNILWGIGGSVFLFARFYQKSDGNLRIYQFIAVLLAVTGWKILFDPVFVKILSVIIEIPVNSLCILKKKLLFKIERGKILFTKEKELFCNNPYMRLYKGEKRKKTRH